MPVMNVREMRMRVRQRLVLMGVQVRFGTVPFEVMRVLVVGIVPVRMRMPHPFVAVLMLMLLRYMQPDARGHQHCRNPEQQAGLLTEQQ